MIRPATETDIPALNKLLKQVLNIHAQYRPDIFKKGGTKYSDEQLKTLLLDANKPIFVALDEHKSVIGYIFCQYRKTEASSFLNECKYCFIDDICVDQEVRGKGVGTALFEYAKQQALQNDCAYIRLNVWAFNESAFHFYEKHGLSPLHIMMEQRI